MGRVRVHARVGMFSYANGDVYEGHMGRNMRNGKGKWASQSRRDEVQ